MCKQPSNSFSFEIENVFKLFISDIGVLNILLNININAILNDRIGIYKGVLVENYVSNQLIANNISTFYWISNDDAEVDFLIEAKNDGVIPIEVKASDNTQSKSLKVYNELYNLKYMIRISSKDFGYNGGYKNKVNSTICYIFNKKYKKIINCQHWLFFSLCFDKY